MKKASLLTAALLFAATIALAQDTPTSQDPSQTPTTSTHTQTSQNATIRGCLSGSTDNYTLTDHNGTQYKLMGGSASLQSAVGHEVQLSGMQNQATESSASGGETMAHSANSFQVSEVKDTGSSCKMGTNSQAAPSERPMDDNPPKGTSPEASDQPHPQLMAMLQQGSNSSGSQPMPDSTQNSSTMPSGQNTGVGGATQTTPPVTSQTPAGSTSPTSPEGQSATTPANSAGNTPAEANSNAQAARQGELSTNPNTGKTTGQGIDGSTPPSTAPNAVPSSTNSTATPQSNTSQPQTSKDDSNKPLWERQATDVPGAGHSSNTGTPSTTTNTTTNPNNPH